MSNTTNGVAPGSLPVPLDTINVSGNKHTSAASSTASSTSACSNSSSSNSPSESKSNNGNRQGVGMTGASPRSIDNMNGFQDSANASSGSVGLPSGRSRRSGNRDSPTDGGSKNGREPPTQIQFGSHGSMVVPSHIIGPPPRAPSPYTMSPVGIPPHHGVHGGHGHSHRRAESWSGNFPPLAPPSPAHYGMGGGNPLIPILSDHPPSETNPLLGTPQTESMGRNSSARRKRKSHGGHRRSHSSGSAYSGMPPNFFQGPPGSELPPPPPPTRTTMEQFSPRGEFMKLTSSFRGTPESPSGRKSFVGSQQYQVSPPGISGRVSFSPHVSASPAHGYGSINVTNNVTMPDFPATGGGEAVFEAHKHGGRHKGESTRKRHMRQQSAQLFMEEVKGIEQSLQCRDVVFLLLFLFHIVGIAFLGTTYGSVATHISSHQENVAGPADDLGDEIELYYGNMLYVCGLSGLFCVCFSLLAFGLMTVFARQFVQIALCLAITISFAWGTIGTGLSPKNVVPITGFVALALSVAYAFIVWERIPFCASNLVTALSGIRANLGALVIAISFQVLSVFYSIYFIFVVVGVYDAIQEGKLELSKNMQVFVYTMMGISFYWTFNVILNIVQVTTAGVISDWWYNPEEANALKSFSKSVFYSMGSICFGSLLVGPVRLIRQLSAFFRPSGDTDSALMCMHECLNCIQTCISSCVDGLANHFNSWAFTYVGIYGYGFMDAGSNATELFRTRGWTMIVTDDLVPNILLMMSLVIGGATGLFAHLIEDLEGLHISSLDQPAAVSFGMGVALGLVVTSVLFGIVSSSVNAVLVCFAASPVDFETNHPELSHEMRSAWREVWPGCMDVVDLRVALANPSPRLSINGGQHGSGIPAEFL